MSASSGCSPGIPCTVLKVEQPHLVLPLLAGDIFVIGVIIGIVLTLLLVRIHQPR